MLYIDLCIRIFEAVIAADETTLYLNAIVHYWTYGTWMYHQKVKKRLPLFDERRIIVLELGSMKDMEDICTNLCQSSTSLSETDQTACMDISAFGCNVAKEIPLKRMQHYWENYRKTVLILLLKNYGLFARQQQMC